MSALYGVRREARQEEGQMEERTKEETNVGFDLELAD